MIVIMAVPTKQQMRWLWTVWIASVVLIAISSLVPELIRIPRTGMVTNFTALALLATLLPALWRAQGDFLLACAAGLSALAVGGSAAFLVVAMAFDRPEAYRSALQWCLPGAVLSALLGLALRRSHRQRP